MIYRKNKKGRFEVETEKGKIIIFDDIEEMISFMKQREEYKSLTGEKEQIFIDIDGFEMPGNKKEVKIDKNVHKKNVTISIDTERYVVEGAEIKKALA